MKISVKTLKGEVFQVEAEANDLISVLKTKIEFTRSDLAADRQKLIHAGKVLKDEQQVLELGLADSDFIVCMITKEVPKKTVAAPVVPAVMPAAISSPSEGVAAPVPTQDVPPPVVLGAPVNNAALQALVGMGFPERDCQAALSAAMGNADLAYEFLLTGIPESSVPRSSVQSTSVSTTGIEQLRYHPQFHMLQRLVQQNPAALSQVLDLIGQQNPTLLQAIHENNDAFIAMMNEPILDNSEGILAPPPDVQSGEDPSQIFQLLATMPAAQRSQFAQSMGLSSQQLEDFMQMMSSMPPGELQAMMNGAGGRNAQPTVIQLTEEEMAAVQRLVALGFSEQEAAQAYLACDKNEMLAANFLLEGGWNDDDVGAGGFHDDQDDDDMYN